MTAQLPSRWKLKKIIETADQIIAEMAKSSSIDEWAFLNDDMGTPSEVKALAEFAMAAHEQEPVAWVMADDMSDNSIISTPAYPSKQDAMEMCIPGIELMPLYTHPAPVPAVPDEIDIYTTDRYVMQYAKGWNACRAAMLNGGKS